MIYNKWNHDAVKYSLTKLAINSLGTREPSFKLEIQRQMENSQ